MHLSPIRHLNAGILRFYDTGSLGKSLFDEFDEIYVNMLSLSIATFILLIVDVNFGSVYSNSSLVAPLIFSLLIHFYASS